jgi:hypothetical protein
METLKLFYVFFRGRDVYFESRQEAKDFVKAHGLKGPQIHRGPDHWRGETDGTYTQTPSSKGGAW